MPSGTPSFGFVCQGANAFVQFVEVFVSLVRIPLTEAVFPDTDQIQFREGGFEDGPSQERLADLARASLTDSYRPLFIWREMKPS
jgi:hypothetical protein